MAGFCDVNAELQAKKIPTLRSGSGSLGRWFGCGVEALGYKKPARRPGKSFF